MALKGTNQEYGRPYNRRLVLETIRLLAPVARGEIAKRVGLSGGGDIARRAADGRRRDRSVRSAPIGRRVVRYIALQTVSTIIRELELQGFVRGVRETPKGRGLPPTVLNINPDGGYAIGVHVTPVGLKAALINLSGDVIDERERALPQASPDRAFREIEKLVASLRKLRPRGRMLGIGLALPGPFDVESMSFVGPTTLEGWKGVPIRERLARLTGLPAFIEADLAAAALGERPVIEHEGARRPR